MLVFPMCACLRTVFVHGPWSPEEGAKFPEAGVEGDCELLCGSWVLNLCPLQEYSVLSTT